MDTHVKQILRQSRLHWQQHQRHQHRQARRQQLFLRSLLLVAVDQIVFKRGADRHLLRDGVVAGRGDGLVLFQFARRATVREANYHQ